jgi:hypothetical protein
MLPLMNKSKSNFENSLDFGGSPTMEDLANKTDIREVLIVKRKHNSMKEPFSGFGFYDRSLDART